MHSSFKIMKLFGFAACTEFKINKIVKKEIY